MMNQPLIHELDDYNDSEIEISEADIQRIDAKVKWYNPEKGYGFLVPDDESSDIFMHFSVLDAAGCRRVEEGDRIVCDIGPGRRGRQVLRVLEVKFVAREPRFAPAFMGQRSPAFDPEALEEIEGEVKWFNPLKGFGFVYPDDGGRDIFLHASVLRAAGYESLEPGVRVSLKVSGSERGREARIMTVIR
ncbi:MAG: cold shock domain-containing protein [Alphaproteobacteria bacterium]|nr:cold shock domain-containing protein [Alphaproteobacteria bacterium]